MNNYFFFMTFAPFSLDSHKEDEVSPASKMKEKPHAWLKELDKSSKEKSVGLSDGHDESDDEPIVCISTLLYYYSN